MKQSKDKCITEYLDNEEKELFESIGEVDIRVLKNADNKQNKK